MRSVIDHTTALWGAGVGSYRLQANVDHLASRLEPISRSDVLQTATDAAQREVEPPPPGAARPPTSHTPTHTQTHTHTQTSV